MEGSDRGAMKISDSLKSGVEDARGDPGRKNAGAGLDNNPVLQQPQYAATISGVARCNALRSLPVALQPSLPPQSGVGSA